MERSFLGLGVVTLVLASALVTTACGSGEATDNGTSGASSSSGATSSSSSSGGSPVTPIVSGSNGSDGKAGEIASCTFDDSVAFDSANPPSVAVVSQATGVAVFIAMEIKVGNVFESTVRRYLLKSANPCALERDKAYVGAEKAVGIAVDAAQRVWGTFPALSRLAPAPVVACTGARGIASSIAIAPGGDHGFGRLLEPDSKQGTLLHFTSDATSCTMTALARTPPPSSEWIDFAVDHLGRAHALTLDGGSKSLGVSVYDATGAELGTYAAPSKQLRIDAAITRCFEGTCIQDVDRVIRYDASLKLVKEYPRPGIVARRIIAADTAGPVFVGGVLENAAAGTKYRIALDILAAP